MLITNLLFSLLLLTEPANGSVDIYMDEVTYYHESETLDSFVIIDNDIMYIIYVKVIDDLDILAAPINDGMFIQLTIPNIDGTYMIYDAVGNIITYDDIKNSEAIWNLKNNYGRTVSTQAYLLIAFVNVDGKRRELRKIIKVKIK